MKKREIDITQEDVRYLKQIEKEVFKPISNRSEELNNLIKKLTGSRLRDDANFANNVLHTIEKGERGFKQQLTDIWNKATKKETNKVTKDVSESSKGTKKPTKEVKKPKVKKEPLVKENFSKHYEKMKEMHPELKGHQIFDRMEIKDKREKAFNYVNKNPEKAMRIGYELEDTPLEQDVNAIRHVLVQILKDGGKIKEAQDISKLASSEFTKAAQDLNIAKLDFLDESQILKNLNDARLEKLGKQLGEADLTKAKEKAKEHIKEKAKNQSKKINEQTKENIKEKMNEYINSIIC